eukprot:CAMPEP_0114457990 /NCGR_PEP_ID=MMETSP0104-20121206/4453_1 /TAXON_ID=37642 ORGANISM="Paraphysomonas imperforata, Strain PA2" /NCGR_SAMPLE_ID=MMETSP0104 /ASSEMBLY_ACC=CAM_ASM_000202 /LENGTH=569 /DNA_ID=CAMNT_0001630565 /DNA_START=14 /DNA_END=1723 /DNA_ORIENTATION=-
MSGRKDVSEPVVGGMSRAAKKRRLEKSKNQGSSSSTSSSSSSSQESAAMKLQSINKFSIFAPPSPDVAIPECSSTSKSKPYTLRDALDAADVTDVDATTRAAMILSLLVQPTTRTDFYDKHWQKRHLHVCRETPMSTKLIYTGKTLEKLLSKHVLDCPTEIVLGRYVELQQQYHNDIGGQAPGEDDNSLTLSSADINAAVISGFGYTLECPQKYVDGVWKLLSCLEFEFGNAMRSSITVSPAGCQAFGPAMNIGDSFFVQLEGSTVIQAYCPTNSTADNEEQEFAWPPPVDYHNVVLDAAELKAKVKPRVNVTLHAGDTLYIPKGWVVECSNAKFTERGVIFQMSTNHHNGVLDLVEVLYPQSMLAVELKGISGTNSATVACQSLPRSYLEFMGVSRSENDKDTRRKEFHSFMSTVMNTVVEKALTMLDPAADQIAKNFLSSRLPIPTTSDEEIRLCNAENNSVFPYSKLRMLRPGIARAVVEDGVIVVYHCMDNSRMLHEASLNPMEFDLDDGPAIEALLDAYPTPVVVMDLHHPSEELEDKVAVAQALFKDSDEKGGSDGEEDDDPF